MHQIILITAMSATTGLFGGGKHCGGKVHHARAASGCSAAAYAAPAPAPAPCGSSASPAMPYASAPVTYPGSPQMAPMMSPAPASAPSPAPPAPAVPPAPTAPPAPASASYAPAGRAFVSQPAYGPTSARAVRRATR